MKQHSQLVNICSAFLAPSKITSTEYLVNGLSNDNFLIRTDSQSYLLKCYQSCWPEVALNAQYELSKQQVCPAPIWLDKQNKRAAFTYVEGEVAESYLAMPLLAKLAKVHAYTTDTQTMDIASQLQAYRHLLVFKQFDKYLNKVLESIANMPIEHGFCHNDLVKENIIVNPKGVYLIDFEYAQTNDVYFDLAALAVSFNLDSSAKQALLKSYQVYTASKLFYLSMHKLECYQVVYLLLCIGWYEQRAINNKVVELRAQLDELLASMGS
ncbi:choline kinase [Pseudoalteromonas sp. Scap03]|jgi:tRNA A-37 threonylcarbamoyl transferase component Bud32|uniref:phosphotransferase family protein n=1 Tax=unclassified Pseudoalteromonas TaxID=194690 RepID=UPI00110BE7D3|nr:MULTISPECIES: phosphotransferase [unclassified Pseudoalteromonas]NWL15463.1 choline kinase [Pseudoalteromonas sp. Scap03]QLE80611.1 phosphotransferase [Pseudoalteromonas sp. Scap25]QLE88554.1 phosphotransferase [Pseudoalteromonas sp. Scap06]TMP72813.1 choline kinase [Pseudoalteromonas sp. S1609]|tara:strand:- start:153 stop:956 length:804 start_codon:yes stop_codon:yes gene_type:complete